MHIAFALLFRAAAWKCKRWLCFEKIKVVTSVIRKVIHVVIKVVSSAILVTDLFRKDVHVLSSSLVRI